MTLIGHQISGVAAGLVVGALLWPDIPGYWLVGLVPAAMAGAVAPDRLEWAPLGSGRWIAHRTWTHWWPIWVGLLLVGLHAPLPALGAALLLAFAAGGLIHLLGDWPNPTGIPIWTPLRRHSLNWWRSGEREWLMVPVFLSVGFGLWWPHLTRWGSPWLAQVQDWLRPWLG
ncbi:MAG: metal-dependent hydrolase [Halothiobacillaceae bacterium]